MITKRVAEKPVYPKIKHKVINISNYNNFDNLSELTSSTPSSNKSQYSGNEEDGNQGGLDEGNLMDYESGNFFRDDGRILSPPDTMITMMMETLASLQVK